MVRPTKPAPASRAEKAGSHFASQQSTAGSQQKAARSAVKKSRIDARSSARSSSLAHSASNSLTEHGSLVTDQAVTCSTSRVLVSHRSSALAVSYESFDERIALRPS